MVPTPMTYYSYINWHCCTIICIHLDDVLKSKKGNFWKFSTPTFKVGINCLSPRRVLQMVGHLQHIDRDRWQDSLKHVKKNAIK